jgi:hypothetical protein
MKGERSRISPARKIVRTLTKEEKEEREREAVKERERLRQEMARKRQDGG